MRKAEPSDNVGPMATKPKTTPQAPETPEQKQARRWLRRFATRALVIDPPLQTVPLGEDGWVQGTKVLAAARGLEDAPGKLTMETLIAVIQTSGARLEKKHDKTTGISVRATSRQRIETDEEKKVFEKDTQKLLAQVKRETRKKMGKKHEENRARREALVKRQQEAATLRAAAREKRLRAAHERALKDPSNARRIADPNDHKKLAKIAPPLKRIGRGTTTADARQAVQDRKR